ncbi:MAG: pyrroloquinoline quinone biosynthesis protein PqqB [Rhizobiales bacterium 32-66-8]|nr:MAG: pyrroloquinoline quinone biosynthesis protein PqqB [Rhizobiales bacterium 32-66-8]
MQVRVLGCAAGGGIPQWNCRCPVCTLAHAGDPRVRARTQSGLAVSADGETWVLLNAAPDLRQQILAAPALLPRQSPRHSPIAAVVLTNAEIDHVAGLLTLREGQAFDLWATPRTQAALAANPMFGALAPERVSRRPLACAEPHSVAGLCVTPFAVPGKVPLYLEQGGDMEQEEIIGLDIAHLDLAHGDRRLVYLPNCARITPELRARIEGADLLLFDGTTFTDDEMVALGLSAKTAARMGHLPMSGPEGSLESLAGLNIGLRVFTHINNSNPALIADSPERQRVAAAGWVLAEDGMEWTL